MPNICRLTPCLVGLFHEMSDMIVKERTPSERQSVTFREWKACDLFLEGVQMGRLPKINRMPSVQCDRFPTEVYRSPLVLFYMQDFEKLHRMSVKCERERERFYCQNISISIDSIYSLTTDASKTVTVGESQIGFSAFMNKCNGLTQSFKNVIELEFLRRV